MTLNDYVYRVWGQPIETWVALADDDRAERAPAFRALMDA